uniref:RNA-directed DNA polymerase n=1 Tax=Rhipicephalus pulchellus TaxID=72859 RepID=L7LW12_RHIPC
MFRWDSCATFRAVSGETLCPLGVCVVSVTLGDKVFKVEFAVLASSTHDIILGIDFLRECGATVDCGAGEILLSAFTDDPKRCQGAITITEDVVLPPKSMKNVPVDTSASDAGTFDVLVDPVPFNCAKKNVLVPRCVLSITDGRSALWVLNYSTEPVMLPSGMRLALFEKNVNSSLIASLSDQSVDLVSATHSTEDHFLSMVNKSLSSEKRQALVRVLAKHASVFDFEQKDGQTSVPESRTRHVIDTGSAHPIRQKPYRVSSAERKIIAQQVEEMLKKNVIQESCSPWAAPVILVRKKDGTWRFCVDYRRLNSVTKKDVYPLPRIDDVIDCLHSASYFSSVDLRSGYWQIPMHPNDKEKTAFITPDGLFEFNVMPFGLCNAPATFERFMDTILRGLKWEVCLCYLDDIIIFGRTFDEHNHRLDTVLTCLERAALTLNSKKCHFGNRETLVLGHLVDKHGVRPDPQKVAAVSSFKQPESIRELRSFLGLCSYFRRFVPKFADLAYPLTCLLNKDVPFRWSAECESSFSQLKFLLTSGPVLRHYDPSAATEVHTDASGVGLGAVLVQRHGAVEHVVAYASRCLSKPERNYTVTEQECLAVVFAVHKFRPYIYGRQFSVITDHHSLCWLTGLRDPSGRLARWALLLQEHDFEVCYKSGRRHADADCLSRLPLPTTACEADNFDEYLAVVDAPFPDLATFRTEQRSDSSLAPFFMSRTNGQRCFVVKDGILYKKNYSGKGARLLLVVPTSLRRHVLRAAHDEPTSGHMGFSRTFQRTQDRFFWPKMRRSVSAYVASCERCQRYKRPTSEPAGLLHPIAPPGSPFEVVGVDLLGPFPRSTNGNRWIIVGVDHLTRYAETAAIPAATATQVSHFMLSHIILRHGSPRVIISDRGRQFVADVVEDLLRLATSHFRHATPYHPQTNGLTERTNRTLVNMISMYVDSGHKTWDAVLPFITFAYNTAQHETTRYSPFYLLYVRQPRTALDTILPFAETDQPTLAETLCRAEEARRIARLRTFASQKRSKKRYDERHQHVLYEKGDLVWLWTPLRKRGLYQKFLASYAGPFVVLARLSDVTYVISRLLSTGHRSRKTDVVHVARLKPFHHRNEN